jgi:hypothetical protein
LITAIGSDAMAVSPLRRFEGAATAWIGPCDEELASALEAPFEPHPAPITAAQTIAVSTIAEAFFNDSLATETLGIPHCYCIERLIQIKVSKRA